MYRLKKFSNISEPTEAERPKRFTRQNSYCSFECRSRSGRKHSVEHINKTKREDNNNITVELPPKIQTESMKIDRPRKDRMG